MADLLSDGAVMRPLCSEVVKAIVFDSLPSSSFASDKRLREATAVFNEAEYDGAIYLAGYAAECALKSCIARQTQQHEFPDKDAVNRSYTHAQFTRDWALVGQWHEDDRYRSGASSAEARDFIAAVQRIVEWIRPSW